MNLDLWLRLNEHKQQNSLSTPIPVLVEGDARFVAQFVKYRKGVLKHQIKDLSSVVLKAEDIIELGKDNRIRRIEAHRHKNSNFNDVMTQNSNVDSVFQGLGLPEAFTGTGVVVGVIDNDFGWEHEDFWTSPTTCRIQSLWIQNDTTTPVLTPFNYGREWSNQEISGRTITYHESQRAHGTQVAGIAAGNGQKVGRYRGVAPEADLVFVAMDFDDRDFMAHFVDAVRYIFDKATALGKPCVINSSVGTYYGSHDATDLQARMIDLMLDERNGRALVQAAGNSRTYRYHVRHNVGGTASRTWFSHNTGNGNYEFYGFADTAQLNRVNFAFDLIDQTNFSVIGGSREYNIIRDFNIPTGGVDSLVETLFYDANSQPIDLKVYAAEYAGVYEIWFRVIMSTSPRYWQFRTMGQGMIDLWSSRAIYGSSDIVVPPFPLASYVEPDNSQTIVSSWACSEKVITVGSYNNRDTFTNHWGTLVNPAQQYNQPRLELSNYSSRGPTRDGRSKPDITSPGASVIAPVPYAFATALQQSNNPNLAPGGWHTTSGGTSMAAPGVAGAVALFLECNNNATWSTIKNAIIGSAKRDQYTFSEGPLPNHDWGYGKLDAMGLIRACVVYGCMDTLAVNYNPLANYPDNSCLYVAVETPVGMTINTLILYPNPNQGQFTLAWENGVARLVDLQVEVFDFAGQRVFQTSLSDHSTAQNIDLGEMPDGAYFVVLRGKGHVLGVAKAIKQSK